MVPSNLQTSSGKNGERKAMPVELQTDKIQDAGARNGGMSAEVAGGSDHLPDGEKRKPEEAKQGQEEAPPSPLRQWIQMIAQEHPYGFVGAVAGASLLMNWLMRRNKIVGAGMAVMTLVSLLAKARVEAKQDFPPSE